MHSKSYILRFSRKNSPNLSELRTRGGFSLYLEILISPTEPSNQAVTEDLACRVEWDALVLFVKLQGQGLPRFFRHRFDIAKEALCIVLAGQFVSHPELSIRN